MAERFSLRGHGCLVTGGTKGIGLACVHELAALGARVVACARSAEGFSALPEGVGAVQADVACRQGREALVEEAAALLEAEGAPLSVLVNNAGTNIRKPTVEYSGDEFATVSSRPPRPLPRGSGLRLRRCCCHGGR